MDDILKTMNQIIMQTLESFEDSQLNFKSESARQLLANKLEKDLHKYIDHLVKEAVDIITHLK
jgi:hypothetical protein